ncbi:hypothetical protein N836_32975 [Leptolyngbya sp. Heron Island J]|uniref:hypothetical protein n=1 Tax=Leptolyngbya sp. Heron Island J TaxID=1385935 RepID=UPI0003B9F130|nr:hypothetical protein [Leptolyngbya sp. Heron Island J]ESA38244.1 hypothetical protein N836_32975 [Leptolyngbya sp. Heron Island J]
MSPTRSVVFLLLSVVGITTIQLFFYKDLDNNSDDTTLINKWNENLFEQQLVLSNSLPKFGYENLYAGWQFLRFLQYFGDSSLRKKTGYGLSTHYFESIVDNDPLFEESYIFLVNTLSMYLGAPEESIRLLEKGLEHMGPALPPRSYFIWRHKATDELLFLGDTQAAKKSHEMAADWAERSPDEEGDFVAALSRKTIEFLETDPSSRPAQIGAWSDVLLRATDEAIRQRAAANIEALGGTILVNDNGQVTVRYKRDEE